MVRLRMDARRYEKHLRSPDGRLRGELLWDGLVPRLPRRARLRVLDAGGGTGELADRFARRGADVTLVERSPEMMRIAEQRLAGRGRVVAGDLEDRHLVGAARFDFVICHFVIEYTD